VFDLLKSASLYHVEVFDLVGVNLGVVLDDVVIHERGNQTDFAFLFEQLQDASEVGVHGEFVLYYVSTLSRT